MQEYHQRDLFVLFPGVPGGRALRDYRGVDYLADIGAVGGRTTVRRHGHAYMAALGERGRAARQRRRNMQPQTLIITTSNFAEIIRIVPYWPPRSTKRRRHPVYVLIYLAAYNRTTGAEVEP